MWWLVLIANLTQLEYLWEELQWGLSRSGWPMGTSVEDPLDHVNWCKKTVWKQASWLSGFGSWTVWESRNGADCRHVCSHLPCFYCRCAQMLWIPADLTSPHGRCLTQEYKPVLSQSCFCHNYRSKTSNGSQLHRPMCFWCSHGQIFYFCDSWEYWMKFCIPQIHILKHGPQTDGKWRWDPWEGKKVMRTELS